MDRCWQSEQLKEQGDAEKENHHFYYYSIGCFSRGGYVFSEYYRKPTNMEKIKPQFRISAAELIKFFEANEQDANNRFLGKVIEVKGKISAVEKNDIGYYTVILGGDGSMSSVRCSMDSAHQQDATGFAAGNEIKIKGACTGFNADELLGSDVILNRCVVSK